MIYFIIVILLISLIKEFYFCLLLIYYFLMTVENVGIKLQTPGNSMKVELYDTINNCSYESRTKQTVVSDLDGTLLRGQSSFPYFMLIAFEGGGVIRAFLLLLLSPLCWFVYHCVSESIGIRLLIFITFAGLKIGDIEAIARGTLPKFYSEDVHPDTWKVLSSFGKRYILTATPRLMVEPFAKTYLGIDKVLGTELHITSNGIATGLLVGPGVLVGRAKEEVLKQEFDDSNYPDVGLGDSRSDYFFMSLCKVSMKIIVNIILY